MRAAENGQKRYELYVFEMFVERFMGQNSHFASKIFNSQGDQPMPGQGRLRQLEQALTSCIRVIIGLTFFSSLQKWRKTRRRKMECRDRQWSVGM
jgi:hypothetical protein